VTHSCGMRRQQTPSGDRVPQLLGTVHLLGDFKLGKFLAQTGRGGKTEPPALASGRPPLDGKKKTSSPPERKPQQLLPRPQGRPRCSGTGAQTVETPQCGHLFQAFLKCDCSGSWQPRGWGPPGSSIPRIGRRARHRGAWLTAVLPRRTLQRCDRHEHDKRGGPRYRTLNPEDWGREWVAGVLKTGASGYVGDPPKKSAGLSVTPLTVARLGS